MPVEGGDKILQYDDAHITNKEAQKSAEKYAAEVNEFIEQGLTKEQAKEKVTEEIKQELDTEIVNRVGGATKFQLEQNMNNKNILNANLDHIWHIVNRHRGELLSLSSEEYVQSIEQGLASKDRLQQVLAGLRIVALDKKQSNPELYKQISTISGNYDKTFALLTHEYHHTTTYGEVVKGSAFGPGDVIFGEFSVKALNADLKLTSFNLSRGYFGGNVSEKAVETNEPGVVEPEKKENKPEISEENLENSIPEPLTIIESRNLENSEQMLDPIYLQNSSLPQYEPETTPPPTPERQGKIRKFLKDIFTRKEKKQEIPAENENIQPKSVAEKPLIENKTPQVREKVILETVAPKLIGNVGIPASVRESGSYKIIENQIDLPKQTSRIDEPEIAPTEQKTTIDTTVVEVLNNQEKNNVPDSQEKIELTSEMESVKNKLEGLISKKNGILVYSDKLFLDASHIIEGLKSTKTKTQQEQLREQGNDIIERVAKYKLIIEPLLVQVSELESQVKDNRELYDEIRRLTLTGLTGLKDISLKVPKSTYNEEVERVATSAKETIGKARGYLLSKRFPSLQGMEGKLRGQNSENSFIIMSKGGKESLLVDKLGTEIVNLSIVADKKITGKFTKLGGTILENGRSSVAGKEYSAIQTALILKHIGGINPGEVKSILGILGVESSKSPEDWQKLYEKGYIILYLNDKYQLFNLNENSFVKPTIQQIKEAGSYGEKTVDPHKILENQLLQIGYIE